MLKTNTLLLAFLIFNFQNAGAANVYRQPVGPDSSAAFISSTLDNFSEGPGGRVLDDFTLPDDTLVGGVNWWGLSNSGGDSFEFRIYSNSKEFAQPDRLLFTTTGSVSSTIVAPGTPYDTGYSEPLNFYSSTFESRFVAKRNTSYWVSIYNKAPDASWLWLTANEAGNGSALLLGDTIFMDHRDLSFEIASVPEPRAVLSLILGVAVLVLVKLKPFHFVKPKYFPADVTKFLPSLR